MHNPFFALIVRWVTAWWQGTPRWVRWWTVWISPLWIGARLTIPSECVSLFQDFSCKMQWPEVVEVVVFCIWMFPMAYFWTRKLQPRVEQRIRDLIKSNEEK